MAISNLKVKLEFEIGEFKKSVTEAKSLMDGAAKTAQKSMGNIQKSTSKLSGIGDKAKNSFGSVTKLAGAFGAFKAVSAVMGTVKNSIGSAFDRLDTMDQFNKTMKIMGVGVGDTKAALDILKGTTKGTAYGLDVAAKATQNFVTRGMGIKDATKSVGVWADAVSVYGKGTNEELASVTTAIGKMRTKGTVEMDQLNTLFDSGIDAVGMYAKAHDMSASDVQSALSKGAISTEDFLSTVENGMATGEGGIRKIAGSAKNAGDSWSGTFSNMGAAVTRGMSEMITSIDNGLSQMNLPSIKEGISSFGASLETGLSVIGEGIIKLFEVVSTAIDFFKPELEAMGEWFSGVFSTISESVTPIFGEMMQFIHEKITEITLFWKENGDSIMQAVGVVFNIISGIISTVMPIIQAIIQTSWQLISNIFNTALSVIMGMIKVFSGLLTGDFGKMWEGIKQITSSVWNYITTLLSIVWNGIKNIGSATFTAIKTLISSVWNVIKSMTSAVWDSISGKISSVWSGIKSNITNAINTIRSGISSVWNNIKSLTSTVWNGIKSAMTSPVESAKNVISGIVDKIKSLFNFKLSFPKISIPHIPLPHFSLSGSFNPLKGKIPSIGINWYATGGIATGASVVGIGEAGDEAIVPLSNKGRMKPFAQAVSSMIDKDSGTGGNTDTGVTVTVNSMVIREESDINKVAEGLHRLAKRERKS